MTALYSNGPEFRAPKDILLQYKTSKTFFNKDSKTGFKEFFNNKKYFKILKHRNIRKFQEFQLKE